MLKEVPETFLVAFWTKSKAISSNFCFSPLWAKEINLFLLHSETNRCSACWAEFVFLHVCQCFDKKYLENNVSYNSLLNLSMLLHVSYFKIYAAVSSLNWQFRRVMIKKGKKNQEPQPNKTHRYSVSTSIFYSNFKLFIHIFFSLGQPGHPSNASSEMDLLSWQLVLGLHWFWVFLWRDGEWGCELKYSKIKGELRASKE